MLRSVAQENLLLVSSQMTLLVEASQSVRPAPSKEETQREAPEAEPSQTRVPETGCESEKRRCGQCPYISRVLGGVEVPMPTLPEESIYNLAESNTPSRKPFHSRMQK